MIFLWFSTQFTRISKSQVLFKLPLSGQTLKTFRFLRRGPYFAAAPLEKNLTLQCHPYGGSRRGWSKIPARCCRSPAGEGRGRSTTAGGLVLVVGGPSEAAGARCTGGRRLRLPLWQPAQENTVLSPKTDPLWSLCNNKVPSCRKLPG
jgi:hypothetical protein